MESTWLWIGTIGMALGAIAFLFMGIKARQEDRPHYMLSFFIPLIAAANYLAMAVGEGDITVNSGRIFYFARYSDWAITTPLLLISLALVASPHIIRKKPALAIGLVLSDVYMILTGLVAGLSSSAIKYVWYIVSCGAFLAVLALIWGPLRAEADKNDTQATGLFYTLSVILSGLWIAYPIVWLIGSAGFNVISVPIETLLYAVLDLAAKVGFGFILLINLGKMHTARNINLKKDRMSLQ